MPAASCGGSNRGPAGDRPGQLQAEGALDSVLEGVGTTGGGAVEEARCLGIATELEMAGRERRERPLAEQARVGALKRELANVQLQIGRLVDALAAGAELSSVKNRLREREAQRVRLEAEIQ